MEILQYGIGIILPPIIDILNRDVKNDTIRFVIALIVSVIAALVTTFPKFHNGVDASFLGNASIVFAEAQIVFNLYYKNSAVRERLQQKIQPEIVPVAAEVTPPAV